MFNDEDQIVKILYNPLSYTHLSHLPEAFLPVNSYNMMLLNEWLYINKNLPDFDETQRDWYVCCEVLLKNWMKMSSVAHLTGGYLLREDLRGYTPLVLTDPLLSMFISLPLKTRVILPEARYSPHDTLRCGAAFILRQFTLLPFAFRQRFLLIFPFEMELINLDCSPDPDNFNLINMAINYANNISR